MASESRIIVLAHLDRHLDHQNTDNYRLQPQMKVKLFLWVLGDPVTCKKTLLTWSPEPSEEVSDVFNEVSADKP